MPTFGGPKVPPPQEYDAHHRRSHRQAWGKLRLASGLFSKNTIKEIIIDEVGSQQSALKAFQRLTKQFPNQYFITWIEALVNKEGLAQRRVNV